jgi:putative PIN family toxin of toxin-antitoxin system
MPLMRVVIDTNVFVSSFFGGNPRKIIDLWKKGNIILCLSPAIVDGYIAVLHRLSLGKEGDIDELLRLFSKGYHIIFTHRTPKLNIVDEDPDDDKFIECAVALNSEFIISGDRALQAVRNYMGIKILSPRDFLDHFPPAAIT